MEASVFTGENFSENLHSIHNVGNNLTMKQMLEISVQLTLEQSDEIFGVFQMVILKMSGFTPPEILANFGPPSSWCPELPHPKFWPFLAPLLGRPFDLYQMLLP